MSFYLLVDTFCTLMCVYSRSSYSSACGYISVTHKALSGHLLCCYSWLKCLKCQIFLPGCGYEKVSGGSRATAVCHLTIFYGR